MLLALIAVFDGEGEVALGLVSARPFFLEGCLPRLGTAVKGVEGGDGGNSSGGSEGKQGQDELSGKD